MDVFDQVECVQARDQLFATLNVQLVIDAREAGAEGGFGEVEAAREFALTFVRLDQGLDLEHLFESEFVPGRFGQVDPRLDVAGLGWVGQPDHLSGRFAQRPLDRGNVGNGAGADKKSAFGPPGGRG